MVQQPWSSHLMRPKTGPDDPELAETLEEGLQQIAPGDLEEVVSELLERRERLAPVIGELASGMALPTKTLEDIAKAVTATRRQAQTLAAELCSNRVPSLKELLDETMPVERRLTHFVQNCPGLERRLALELATGLLHLAAPRRYWLWTRWLWDVQHQTGILPLLASSTHQLQEPDVGRQYRQLGALTALGAELGQKSGLVSEKLSEDPVLGPFATDAFLALTYSVYLYGITSWRLSREFNRLLPPLTDLARRLLGLPSRRSSEA